MTFILYSSSSDVEDDSADDFLMDLARSPPGAAHQDPGAISYGSPSNLTAGMDGEGYTPLYAGPDWIIVPIVFGLIFVIGVIGNGTLIFTVIFNKPMRNTPNVLLVSLALGDLLLILIAVPFSSTIYTFPTWPYGQIVCKLNEFLIALSLGVSVFTLTALSGERYMVIVHPMSSHRSHQVARTSAIAVGIWLVSAALGSLELYAAHVHVTREGGNETAPHVLELCVLEPEGWSPKALEEYGKFHSMFRFLVYFALPIAVITYFYAMMARMLMISSKQMPGEGVKQQGLKQMEARKKVARVVLSFVAVFAVSWLPRHIYYLWYNYDPAEFNMFWHVFKIVGFCMSFINSCVNPLALYFLSKQFRIYYNRYLFCCCPCAKPPPHGLVAGGGVGGRGSRGAGASEALGTTEELIGGGGGRGGGRNGGGICRGHAGTESPTSMPIYLGNVGHSNKSSLPMTTMTSQTAF